MISTPINPIVTAAHLREPTISFKNITEKIVINNGLIKKIATPSANGKAAKPKKMLYLQIQRRNPLKDEAQVDLYKVL